MSIDIDSLSEADLVDLNHRIVARLNLLRQIRNHNQMLEYRIGDKVSFVTQSGHLVSGTLTKFNRKTVTVITEDGHHWNVSPSLLRRVGGGQGKAVTVHPIVEEKSLETDNKSG